MLVEPPGQDYLRAHVKLKLLALLSTAGGSALSALWTFPSILASAFLVAWGAEAAQFLISQGLALAILAWLQTLPEFAVEAVIAWDAGRDPTRAHLAIANRAGARRRPSAGCSRPAAGCCTRPPTRFWNPCSRSPACSA